MRKKSLLFVMLFVVTATVVNAKVWTVQVANFQFSPATLNVTVGDTVRWVWVSGTHTTTSTSVPADAPTWNSPIDAGTTSFDYTVKVAGTYNYWCTIHAPTMAGVINASGILPVVLNSFTILPAKQSGALIQWSTATETNTDYFVVKKSTNATDFTEVSKVKASGNSSSINNYSVTDNNLGSSNSYVYYMIEIVDKDGSSTFSSIQRFINSKAVKKIIIQLSPNPVTAPGHLMLQFNADKEEDMQVQLYDNTGKLVKQDVMHGVQGINNGHFHMGNLSAGIYTIVFSIDGRKETYKVVMQ